MALLRALASLCMVGLVVASKPYHRACPRVFTLRVAGRVRRALLCSALYAKCPYYLVF